MSGWRQSRKYSNEAHNIALRAIAVHRGWKLNEYGLFSGRRRIAGATEEEIYKKLGLAFIPPEMREHRGEVALAKANKLPLLVTRAAHILDFTGRDLLGEKLEHCRNGFRRVENRTLISVVTFFR